VVGDLSGGGPGQRPIPSPIPRESHVLPFSSIGSPKPQFNGRLIVVAHGDVDGFLLTGEGGHYHTGKMFHDRIDNPRAAENWAESINRIDFCVCCPASTGFKDKFVEALVARRAKNESSFPTDLNGWLATGLTTPMGSILDWGTIRSMGPIWEEALAHVFPFWTTPGVRMPGGHPNEVAAIGPWVKLL
jgi:hypothetical protein